jgi:hypothetical protein
VLAGALAHSCLASNGIITVEPKDIRSVAVACATMSLLAAVRSGAASGVPSVSSLSPPQPTSASDIAATAPRAGGQNTAGKNPFPRPPQRQG